MFMEIFTVFLPCWEVMRHQTLRQETLDAIAQWESNNKSFSGGKAAKSIASGSTMVDSIRTGWKSHNGSVKSNSGESILTMSALEHVLERNPEPLQQFSALRDFSGENIAFLTSVSDWKSALPASVRNAEKSEQDANSRELVRERFNRALRIYADFISTRDAEFPINISSTHLKQLETIFETPARIMYGDRREVDLATPFEVPGERKLSEMSETSSATTASVDKPVAGDRVQYWGDIPDDFNGKVFDEAEKSIKYLVLTNTWPKFVKDRRSSMDSALSNAEAGNMVNTK